MANPISVDCSLNHFVDAKATLASLDVCEVSPPTPRSPNVAHTQLYKQFFCDYSLTALWYVCFLPPPRGAAVCYPSLDSSMCWPALPGVGFRDPGSGVENVHGRRVLALPERNAEIEEAANEPAGK
jgi:hypothetical protein